MAKPQLIDNGIRTKGSTIRISRAPTKRLSTAIALYMPASVQVTYGAQYQDTPVGAVTEQALNAYNDILAGRGTDAVGQLGTIPTQKSQIVFNNLCWVLWVLYLDFKELKRRLR